MSTRLDRLLRCADDPVAFAVTYLGRHLRSDETGGEVTLSSAHWQWAAHASEWITPPAGPMEQRDVFVAPRSMGKSTWWFLILPLWAAAFGHVRFVAAFADSAAQAENHLQTFKHELDTNALLRQDFPKLVAPARRPRGAQVADNRAMLFTASGFVFAARGMDSSSLGMKVGERRPDLLIFDDIEPDESSYSSAQAAKRLTTFTDAMLPLNVNARVVMVGTVTMPDSIVHQAVKSVREPGLPVAQWIADERFVCHYTPPVLLDDDGTERSVWPERWPLPYLKSIAHTRAYAKNYLNDPIGADGAYWSPDDFTYGEDDDESRLWLLSIDPAVTVKRSSDFTGLAVISCRRDRSRATVEHVEEVKLSGADLRLRALNLLERFPRIALVLIESNQGGEIWGDILHHLPVKLRTVYQQASKEFRAAQALNHYQRGRVWHARRLAALEAQQVAFPNAQHDDMVDAVGTGITYFLGPHKRAGSEAARSLAYR